MEMLRFMSRWKRMNYILINILISLQHQVSLYVLSVEEINEMFMDYTFDMYFR